MMNSFYKTAIFPGTCLILAAVILFCTTQTVMSQSRERQQAIIEEKYYEKWESEYLAEIDEILAESGLKNAGVTMTRTGGGEEARRYDVLLHHKRLERMDVGEQQALLAKLQRLSFPVDTCSFSFRIF